MVIGGSPWGQVEPSTGRVASATFVGTSAADRAALRGGSAVGGLGAVATAAQEAAQGGDLLVGRERQCVEALELGIAQHGGLRGQLVARRDLGAGGGGHAGSWAAPAPSRAATKSARWRSRSSASAPRRSASR